MCARTPLNFSIIDLNLLSPSQLNFLASVYFFIIYETLLLLHAQIFCACDSRTPAHSFAHHSPANYQPTLLYEIDLYITDL